MACAVTVKLWFPPGVVPGTLIVAVICVLLAEFTVAPMPPLTLTVGLLPNPAPEIVTEVLAPATTFAGETLVMIGLT